MRQECKKCNGKASYNSNWDCYYCEKCDEWTEPRCSDDKCNYCSKRPFKPSIVPNLACPFCDEEDITVLALDECYPDRTVHFVQCLVCDAKGPVAESNNEALTLWNNR